MCRNLGLALVCNRGLKSKLGLFSNNYPIIYKGNQHNMFLMLFGFFFSGNNFSVISCWSVITDNDQS